MTAVERQRLAVDLRKGGASYEQIAQRCGYRDKTGAYQAVKSALRKTLQEPADELRTLECERLDRALLAIWPSIIIGDVKAIDRMVKIMHRRAQLLGLDVPVAGGVGDESALEALMRTLKDRHPVEEEEFE